MGRPRDKLVKLHPFGQLLESMYKKHGCSPKSLATAASGLSSTILSEMAVGAKGRLTRENVLRCIEGFTNLGFIEDADDANYFLDEARFNETTGEYDKPGFERLNAGNLRDRQVLELINEKAKERKIALEKPKYGKPLVGRDEAIAKVCELLKRRDIRLLTLTGAPGIGKTSLAENVVDALNDNSVFDDVFFIYLDTISEQVKDKIVTAIALKVGIGEKGSSPLLDRLKTYLYDKHILLVLDNCEHLIQACAELAEELLQDCQHLTLLTTSTERLRTKRGETVRRVQPLRYPDLVQLPPTERMREYSAVELFETCRREIVPNFTVTDDNASAVAQICARLNGHPLAIRLAAGCEALSVWQITEELDNCLTLLRGGSRTGSKRHMTIQETIEWRYDLLPEPGVEKLFLQRLSVFRGGWTQQAANAVCTGDGLGIENIREMIEDLARKSLIEVTTHGKINRTSLLEIIRQFAYGKLGGKAEDIHRRHRDFFYQKLLEESQVRDKAWFATWEVEKENLRAALNWCKQEQDNEETFLQLVIILSEFWLHAWEFKEGLSWLEEAITKSKGKPVNPIFAHAVYWAGIFTSLLFMKEETLFLMERSAAYYGQLGYIEQENIARMHSMSLRGNLKEASTFRIAYLEKQLVLHSAKNEVAVQAENYYQKGMLLLAEVSESSPEALATEARVLLEKALGLFHQTDDLEFKIKCLRHLGLIAFAEKRYEDAANLFQEHLALLYGHNSELITIIHPTLKTLAIGYASCQLGDIMMHLGNIKAAIKYYKQGVSSHYSEYITSSLQGLAKITRIKGLWEQAAHLYGFLEADAENYKAERCPYVVQHKDSMGVSSPRITRHQMMGK